MITTNDKFESLFESYMSSKDDKYRQWALYEMISMFNSMELRSYQYKEKYEVIFPEMGDLSLFQPVDVNEFLGVNSDDNNNGR